VDLGLEGAKVVVTGGSSGLGAALVDRLLREGALVATCARSQESLARLHTESPHAERLLTLPADVTVPVDLERFVHAAAERFGGRIDALVNNAGTASVGRFEDVTDEQWQADLDLKLFASIRATRLVLPFMRSAGGGTLINVLSIRAKAPTARSMPTAVSRAAQVALTKALSFELGPDGIRSNAVLIGTVESAQHERRAAEAGQGLDEFYAALGERGDIPLGRVGAAEEFADLVAFLVSPRGAYITGVAINFDGGASPAV
jgi:NAD(P)-dependent dehydrogenase (short-subunit alcohol dehydrogenase family)